MSLKRARSPETLDRNVRAKIDDAPNLLWRQILTLAEVRDMIIDSDPFVRARMRILCNELHAMDLEFVVPRWMNTYMSMFYRRQPEMRVFWTWLDQFQCWDLMTFAATTRAGPDLRLGIRTSDDLEYHDLKATYIGSGNTLKISFFADEYLDDARVKMDCYDGASRSKRTNKVEFLTQSSVERALTRVLLTDTSNGEDTDKAISLLYTISDPASMFI